MPRGPSHRVEEFPRRRFGHCVFPTTCRQTFYLVIRGRPLIPIHRALRIACRLRFRNCEGMLLAVHQPQMTLQVDSLC